MQQKEYIVYIVTNTKRTVFYIGITNNIQKRWYQHKEKIHLNSFTARYNLTDLIYIERYTDISVAIKREKQLKKWSKKKKIALIHMQNPMMKTYVF